MSNLFLGLLLPNILALVLVMASMPFHVNTHNVVTISMGFWLSLLSTIHIINCIIWRDNADIRAPVWGDITSALTIGFHYGLPLAHFMLARQLANMTALVQESVIFSIQKQRREALINTVIAITVPIIGMCLQISVMERRFAIMEGFGPIPYSTPDGWGFTVIAAFPILLAIGATYYTLRLLVNLYLRHRDLVAMCYESSSIRSQHFMRLTALATVMFVACLVRLVADVVFRAANTRLDSGHAHSRQMWKIETYPASSINGLQRESLLLQWSGNVICSVVFFLCFVTSSEVKRFYVDAGRKAFCLKSHDNVCSNGSSEDSYQLRSKASTLIKSPEQENFFDVLAEGPGGSALPTLSKNQKAKGDVSALSFEDFLSKGSNLDASLSLQSEALK